MSELPFATWTEPYLGGPTGFYSSQWAEVLYYLVRTGSTEEPNNPGSLLGTPIYGLYRAQFVMVPDGANVSTLYTTNPVPPIPVTTVPNQVLLSQTTFAGMSCYPVTTGGTTALTFFSPADAAVANRVIPDLAAFNPDPASSVQSARVFAGATLVCPNVLSFQVQVMQLGPPGTTFDDNPSFSLRRPSG